VVDSTTGNIRQAYVDDLTETQLKFIFYAQQERERMKMEGSKSSSGTGNTTYL